MRAIDQFWTTQGRVQLRPGLGPDGHAMLFVPGSGGPTGYRSSASFLALVEPGQTYTFSAYIDATGYQGTPPFVVLDAVNGSWTGVSVYQLGKGVVSKTFSVPADSGTTLVRGTFGTENGTYPIGRGAAFSEPQIEPGDFAHDYVGGGGGELMQPPAGGNLVVDSDLHDAQVYWELTGRMRLTHTATSDGAASIEFDGDGRPSGFDNTASFLAGVKPGATYTFSIHIDSTGHTGTPPYVFLEPVDGTWTGTKLYSGARGIAFVKFTLPRDCGTTLIRVTATTQNGTYPHGTKFIALRPQLSAGGFPSEYESGDAATLPTAPGGNLVIDSGLRDVKRAWRLDGAVRVKRDAVAGHSAIVYDGDGHASGFTNRASFYARVTPGRTYTFSALIDGSAAVGTPPYVFLRAVDGTWAGTQLFQPGNGRIFQTFTIPGESRTTCVTGWISPQNGAYPHGTHMTFSQPQIAQGAVPSRYVEGPRPTASSRAQGGCH
jgi:hypothetical protein